MASATEALNFEFYLISLDLNLNSHMWQVTTICVETVEGSWRRFPAAQRQDLKGVCRKILLAAGGEWLEGRQEEAGRKLMQWSRGEMAAAPPATLSYVVSFALS